MRVKLQEIAAIAIAAMANVAYALPAVRSALPPVEYIDTETVTNVAFTAWEQGLKEFRFDLEFIGTASNNVEMAFGTDADGNGRLSDGEVDVVAGWDCGEWFILSNVTDERVTEAATSAGAQAFSCVFEMRSSGRIVNAAYTNNGEVVFAELAASKSSWLYSVGWNMVRLVGRGENVRSGERFSAKITPCGFAVRLM